MLHTINKSPFEKDSLSTCMRYLTDDSSVLFIEDGVYSCLKKTNFENLINNNGSVKYYVLGPDLQARGLDKNLLINNIEIIDYKGFVKLTVENEKIQNWL